MKWRIRVAIIIVKYVASQVPSDVRYLVEQYRKIQQLNTAAARLGRRRYSSSRCVLFAVQGLARIYRLVYSKSGAAL